MEDMAAICLGALSLAIWIAYEAVRRRQRRKWREELREIWKEKEI